MGRCQLRTLQHPSRYLCRTHSELGPDKLISLLRRWGKWEGTGQRLRSRTTGAWAAHEHIWQLSSVTTHWDRESGKLGAGRAGSWRRLSRCFPHGISEQGMTLDAASASPKESREARREARKASKGREGSTDAVLTADSCQSLLTPCRHCAAADAGRCCSFRNPCIYPATKPPFGNTLPSAHSSTADLPVVLIIPSAIPRICSTLSWGSQTLPPHSWHTLRHRLCSLCCRWG